MNELLEKLKRRVANKDELLLMDLLIESVDEAKDFTRQDDAYVIQVLGNLCVQLSVIKCNRLGNEGITTTSVSGISESYEADLPMSIKKQLYKHRRMRK